MTINTKRFGYLRSFVVGVIPATTQTEIQLDTLEIDEIDFLNVIDIANTDAVNVDIYLDGNTDKRLRILANTSKSLNGTRFKSIVIKNLDPAVDTVDGKILITIQKEFGRAEENEIRYMRGTA